MNDKMQQVFIYTNEIRIQWIEQAIVHTHTSHGIYFMQLSLASIYSSSVCKRKRTNYILFDITEPQKWHLLIM